MSELTCSLFDPVMGRHQMETHDHSHSLRTFNIYFIDFVKLPFKCNDALNFVLQTSIHVVFMLADRPVQFFPK